MKRFCVIKLVTFLILVCVSSVILAGPRHRQRPAPPRPTSFLKGPARFAAKAFRGGYDSKGKPHISGEGPLLRVKQPMVANGKGGFTQTGRLQVELKVPAPRCIESVAKLGVRAVHGIVTRKSTDK